MNKQRQFLFHPVTVLVASLLAAAVFALFVTIWFEGEFRWYLLYYFTPVGIPFVAFLFDRAEHSAQTSMAAWIVDVMVLIPALTRAFIRLPLVSGHALFLSFCLFTTESKVARVIAVLVLIQVAYLKLFVTHDRALSGGVIGGCLAAYLYRQIKTVKKDAQI